MKKIIATITLCSIIFSTQFVYGENEQVDLEKKLTENRDSQLRLDEQIIELNSKIKEIEANRETELNKIKENLRCVDKKFWLGVLLFLVLVIILVYRRKIFIRCCMVSYLLYTTMYIPIQCK